MSARSVFLIPVGSPIAITIGNRWIRPEGPDKPSGHQQEAFMWTRSCALCKAVLRKFHLSETVRCQCGWQW